MPETSNNPYAPPSFETWQQTPVTLAEDELADRGTRLVAALLDAIVLLPVMVLLFIFGAARLCIHDHIAFSKVVKFQQNRPRLS